jgi:predicted N-formylglutamate amidohydrolase
MTDPLVLPGHGPVLLLCDHASDVVPGDIALGVPPEAMARHIAIDIGAGPLTHALAGDLGAPAVLGGVSRLVIDLHREPDHPALIPLESDGQAVPGNMGADRAARIARFHAPYHRAVAAAVRAHRPMLIVAIHSFTRRLATAHGPPRAWDCGVLYNRDTRAARPAIAFLRGEGLIVGDNEPYSGRLLNATLNRHAEANGIASLSLEVRNDLIAEPAGVARWTKIIGRMIVAVRNTLALNDPPAT